MVEIKINNSELSIEDSEDQIFSWNHRSFLNLALGLEIEEELHRYFSMEEERFSEILHEVVAYFNDEKISYKNDSAVENIVSTLDLQKKEFNDVKIDIDSFPVNTFTPPLSFKRKLMPYQEDAVQHMIKIHNDANFSVPGSGKTTAVYAYYSYLLENKIVDKIFVVGPLSCFAPWEEEGKVCFGRNLKSARLLGSAKRNTYNSPDNFELFLCHYQTFSRDIEQIASLFQQFKFLVVIDESHYMKRFEGGAWSSAILRLAPICTRRIILSGTPMPNGYIDLWSQFTFLWPGKQLLGDRNAYKTRCEDPKKREDIKREIRPFFYRVKKIDLDLPPSKIIKTVYDLKPVQAKIYEALSVKLLSDLNLQPDDRLKLRQWRKAKMIRLIQTASNPALLAQYSDEFEVPPLKFEGSPISKLIEEYNRFEVPPKIEGAVQLVKKIMKEGKKVVLWTSFIHNILTLEKLLKDTKHFKIYGAIPKDDKENIEFNREQQIREFKEINEPAVLIANPAACAESISLHMACHDAVYLDRTFNCGQFIQSLDRIHRIGSPKQVNYHILVAKNTIDSTIDMRLIEKQSAMVSVLEDEIPIGSLDVENFEMEATDDDERIDFEETIKGIRKTLNIDVK